MRLYHDVVSDIGDPYLRRAAELAERGRGSTAPNPVVGAVVVRDGTIVGEGFHPRAGEPHAEVFALAHAGASARGATMYVTLEPCDHHGRTPPCTEAIIAAGVSRVVIGMPDPTEAAGGGARRLHDAGIAVSFAKERAPFERLNEGWLTRMWRGRPFVTVKVALTLDGRVALEPGQRAAITGPSGSEITRRLRSTVDAVLVGGSTVISDDPALTVRDAEGTLAERQPLRVVLAGGERIPPDSTVFTDGVAPTIVLHPDGSPVDATGLIAAPYPADAGIEAAVSVLGERGVNDLLVEPGPRLFSSLWEADLVDRLVTVTAGGMAGAQGPSVYVGRADRSGDAIAPVLEPARCGIEGNVSVVVWERPAV